MTRIRYTVLSLLLAAGVSGCSVWGTEGGPGAAGAAQPTTVASTAPVRAEKGADGVQRVTVTIGDDLRLHPDTIVAVPGTIAITFRNTGVSPHDMSVDTPTAAGGGNINSGAQVTVTVTATQPGSYPMPCAYHETSGMTGTLHILAQP